MKVLNDSKPIESGYLVRYNCSKGMVLDSHTNRRSFFLRCNDKGEYEKPSAWPVCRKATHCVGPVARPSHLDDVYLPIPRRDSPINTNVKYKCKQNTARLIYAGCFHDGRYRYEPGWPSCDENPSPNLCKESEATENSSVIIAIPGLNTNSHGWLTSPEYPSLSSTTSACSWSVKAPYGYIIAFGIEDLRGSSANASQPSLEIFEKSSHLPPRQMTAADKGRTYFTLDHSAVIRTKPGPDIAWRISYLVVEPT